MRLVLVTTVMLSALILLVHTSEAQVMTSGSYQIQSDSINFGGGLSSSTGYILESTAGEVGTGPSESASYQLRAGYQQMQSVFLSLKVADDVVMAPAIDGLIGGESDGVTALDATTDSSGGYQLTIAASDSPAMNKGPDSIADYVPDGASPDLHFTTASNEAHFAFSPFGDDVIERYQTDGASCGVSGVASTTACWDGLSTTASIIAQRTSSNHSEGGTETLLFFKVGVGPAANPTAGDYTATTTVTLLAL